MNSKIIHLATSGLVAFSTAIGLNALNAMAPVNLLDWASLNSLQSQQAVAQDAEESVNVRVYQAASPAVVSIRAGDGTGSGSIISPDGLVLTNAHVVGSAQTVTVILADGREFQGEVIAFGESGLDLAAIRIAGQNNLPALRLASLGSVEVGQRAFAIGNPFGRFQGTFTTGIVSRIDRDRGLVQTDAAINPGNSGGPLLNSRGEIIGVNSSIFTTGRASGNIGIGFAISMDRVQPFLTAVREGRAPRTAQERYLGGRAPQTVTLNGRPISGSLDSSSNVLPADNSFFNVYTFQGQAGQQVVIDMSSDEFDAYLILLAPDGSDLAQDDDGGGNTNARIAITLPDNGTYTILANSYSSGETGNYNLRVATEGSPSQQVSRPQPSRPQPSRLQPGRPQPSRPQPSAPQPQPNRSQQAGFILQEQGNLGPGASVLREDGSLYREHTFQGQQGQRVTISLESNDFDTYLILLDADGGVLEQNDDRCAEQRRDCLNSEINIVLPYTGTYRIIANAFDNTGRGRYSLTVR